ncbi:MAG: hypothetical protein OEV42_07980 [Deltaproteobacteria bacterium]|nr:hypothetical protein [Deltaproteobacteria bacterium]
MGVYYNCYLIPEIEKMNYTPDGDTLVSLANKLFELEWAGKAESYETLQCNGDCMIRNKMKEEEREKLP